MRQWDDLVGRAGAALSDTSVVRILDASGRPAGAGFLTGEQDVVTCAHVVASVSGPGDPVVPGSAPDAEAHGERGRPPEGRVVLDFPLTAPGHLVQATVVAWVPVQADGTGDIAVLRLVDPPPSGAAQARLVEDGAEAGLRVRTVGFPEDNDAGAHSAGVLRGLQATGWYQYDTDPASQFAVQRGFSGAPVWDRGLGGVVGMVVSTDTAPDRRTAYVIPTAALCAAWPPLRQAAKARSPFRDLRPFQESDAAVFHGREDAARRIADRMTVGSGLTLVGSSGSGKSSLVNAGVLPLLRQHGDLAIGTLRPGRTPLEAVSLTLLPLLRPDATQTELLAEEPQVSTVLREGRIATLVNQVLAAQGRSRLLLVVDQFEEALAGSSETELQLFASVLGHCTQPGARMQVLMALRADFLDAALGHPAVAPLVDDSRLFPLIPMSEREVRAAVERPLSGLGVRYEHGLVNRLLADLGPDPARLPLLQFTLTRLWDMQGVRNGVISHAHYDALGGVSRTLANHADLVWKALPSEDHEHARRLLLQLVHPGGPHTSPTRRTVARTDLPNEQWRVAERLMTTRLLMPTEEYRPGGRPVEGVELAHETLLTQWHLLRELVAANQGFRSWQEGLRQRIAHWEAEGRSAGRRLAGSELREAWGWQKERPDELTDVERQFIAFSRSRTHRRRLLLAAVSAAMALLAATVTFVWRHGAESEKEDSARATAAAVLAQQSRDAADGTTQGDPYNALLLAMRAYRTRDTTTTRRLLAENYGRYGFADLIVPSYASPTSASLTGGNDPSISADGRTVVSRSVTGEELVWRLGGGPEPRRTGRREDLKAVSPNGSLIVMAMSQQLSSAQSRPVGGPPVVLYDVRSGRVVRQLQAPAEGDRPPKLSEPFSGLPSLGGLPSGMMVPTEYAALAYDPTGRRIAAITGVGGMSGRIIVWDAATGRIERTLKGPDEMLSWFSFTAGGQGLVAAGQDIGGATSGSLTTLVRTWDLAPGESAEGRKLLTLPWKDDGRLGNQLVDVSPDGGVLAVGTVRTSGLSVDADVVLHRLPDGRTIGSTRRLPHNAAVTGITVTAGGGRVIAYDTATGLPGVQMKPVPGVQPVFGPWQVVDTYGIVDGTTAALTGRGLNALVRAEGHGDPMRRLPAAAAAASSPPGGLPQQWFQSLCRKLGDTALPDAVEQKMPPGAYRGPLCP
ncbi:trypsin-like peptidase domain-containing protein [Streptomyces sp. NPDC001851]|uniref:nSTAND1 domain-containing NTPase n=1 Tax=Streptomyces sp. NPDC001851 TaxID=3154529 RepID=UPI00331CE999